jgi:phosphoribosylformylglycinamidine synthase
LASLEKNNQIIFRYCDKDGKIGGDANPNGAINDIAGICNTGRNVFGMMPHPERASNPALNNTDGVKVFELLGLLKTAAAL